MNTPTPNTPVVVANWKMNPDNLRDAQLLFDGIKRTASYLKKVTTVICPPALFLGALTQGYGGSKILLGSQDVSRFSGVGSQTGEMSADMLADSGVKTAIIGHSERRAMGEGMSVINKKIKNALAAGLEVIYCIGESTRDEEGEYLSFLKSQILDVFRAVPTPFYDQLTIAYEPLWAIGGGADKAVTPHDLHQTTLFIRKVLRNNFSVSLAKETTILYGGSVKKDNAKELFVGTDVDGFLVGGASLEVSHFCDILRTVNDVSDKLANE